MGAAAAVVDDSGAPGVGSGATGEDQLSLARPAARDAKASLSRPEIAGLRKIGWARMQYRWPCSQALQRPQQARWGSSSVPGSRASLHLRRAEDISSTCRGHHPSHTAPKRPHIRAPSLLEVRTKSAVTRRHFDVPHVASGPAPRPLPSVAAPPARRWDSHARAPGWRSLLPLSATPCVLRPETGERERVSQRNRGRASSAGGSPSYRSRRAVSEARASVPRALAGMAMTGKLIVALAVLTSQLAHAKPECALEASVVYNLTQAIKLESETPGSMGPLSVGATASPTSAPTWEGVDICFPVRAR